MQTIERLRELLTACQPDEPLPWEPDVDDGVHPTGTIVCGDYDEGHWSAHGSDDATLLRCLKLSCEAVNALPALLAVVEAACAWQDAYRADGDGDGELMHAVDVFRRGKQ